MTQYRRYVFGENIIPPQRSLSFLELVYEAAQDFILFVLMVCAVISITVSLYDPEGNGILFILFFHRIYACYNYIKYRS